MTGATSDAAHDDLSDHLPARRDGGATVDADGEAPTRPPVVSLSGISRAFPGSPEVLALRGVDLQIDGGEYVSIIGPSGSGKSTLLHILGLLDRPTSGRYRLGGVDVASMSESDRAAMRGGRIGFVFQAFHLMANRTVLDNVMLPLIYQSVARRERRSRAEVALAEVGMSHRLGFPPTTLSGGEQQRVAIARALVSRPSLLLADEPTGNLDQDNAAGVLELLDDLNRAGMTVAVITHDDSVSRRAQRRVRISDGQLGAA